MAKHKKPISTKPPRFGQQERQLSRFFEPLVLLYTLGSTRGEHSCDITSAKENLSHLSFRELRRTFLRELAYMCDYDKGGDTVAAIGLEFTPQKHIFWIASNMESNTKVVQFLNSLLAKLSWTASQQSLPTSEGANGIAEQYINFAIPRIKKYRSHLKPVLRRCLEYLNGARQEDDLCRLAYQERNSDFMRTLGRLSKEPSYKTNRDAIHQAFRLVRHYIGRLGHHFRAAEVLHHGASSLHDVLHDFEVRSVPTTLKSAIPPADGMTTLENMIVRMLPAKSIELHKYQRALTEMDFKYQLSRRFKENYESPNLKPRVHAEIKILEHFYARNLLFADNDPFVACSKPACYCCQLYFRHHPAQYVEPNSHQKIYLNWRPPTPDTKNDRIDENHQRDILNLMVRDIRKEALRQIHEKAAPTAWHPDSLTGITESAVLEQKLRASEEAKSLFPSELLVRHTEILEAIDHSVPITSSSSGEEMSSGSEAVHSERSEVVFESFLEDSDEEGGIPL
ncbi:uncharacterized protein K460DRAFT_425966 [Cucurbitaria berberidis CBS 394.84]|uniref:Uncharacterized protein n=1 Tax=Cucurbitaria berberidis CBS 394.84 TaxID=1168544 RepID=A0A9P4GLJ6_9PLEO|nr:uncharacterized protein K460DRAFT_425966 [Cucurbitaria berberidis CBS 394.84]KAF1847301.1 hypothetical protein K460DRAFT_425966 [Cucurbitaria berberidis CBS 394.84]